MPIAQTLEQLALAESVGQWAKRAGTIAAVRGLEKGGPRSAEHWAGHWAGLAELGIFGIGLPEESGGAAGTAVDVAVVAERLAAALAPGPVLPTLLAGLVVAGAVRASQPAGAAVAALAPRIASGEAAVGVAMSASGLTGVAPAGGGLRVSGTANLVLGAGGASHLLLGAATELGETWFLTEPGRAGLHVLRRTPVDFSRPLADVMMADVLVEPAQVLHGVRAGLVADLAATLAAAEASGVAAWCTQTAAEYARTRHQFGRPIGAFQAIKHLCATMLCRSELITAAAWDAACAADDAPDEHPLAAAAAAVLALDAAVDNAKDCIQVLGGIGFTWEHDAHLYLRRAVSLRSLLGGSSAWRARAAELALEGVRRHPAERTAGQDSEPAGAEDVRSAARIVANAVSAMPADHQRAGLAEVGYAAPGWPPPYGLSAGPAAQLIIDEELASAGITRPDLGIGGWAIPAIAAHGSTDQLARFAGPTLRGEITWCQLFSEPEAGSDLASLRTRAERVPPDGQVGGGWRLTGQKVWTSLAQQADWAICLARTDPSAPKHKGITFFLVPMRDPGIEIRPLREITGRAMFNEVFLDGVLVPDALVVGQPGDGWRVARTTLATERVAMVRGARLSEDVEALLAAVRQGPIANPMVLDQIGLRLAEGLALAVMDERIAGSVARGGEAGMMAAVRKLLGVTHRQSVAETALTLCGIQGAAADGHAAVKVHEFLLVRCLSIAGGSSQILLSLVAERVLGLPRDEAR